MSNDTETPVAEVVKVVEDTKATEVITAEVITTVEVPNLAEVPVELVTGTPVTLAAVEQNPAFEKEIQSIAQNIDFSSPSLTVSYGAQTMIAIADFSDSLLSKVRAKDAGYVGDALTTLLIKVKEVDISPIAEPAKKSFWQRIPLIGRLFKKVERTIIAFDTVSGQIDKISIKLDEAMHTLLKDISMLEQLYVFNEKNYTDLSINIAAGKMRLEQAKTQELEQLKKQAEESGDAIDAQKVRDFADIINRFDRRLHDLQLSRTIAQQTAPQIRLIQNNNKTLAEKIQTSILATIPIWKNQMVLALSIQNQRKAADIQKEVTDTTNDLLKKNAQMLEEASVTIAHEVERSVIDIETIKEVHNSLIRTIEETLQISSDAYDKRRAVEKELHVLEEELRKKVVQLAVKKDQQRLDQASN